MKNFRCLVAFTATALTFGFTGCSDSATAVPNQKAIDAMSRVEEPATTATAASDPTTAATDTADQGKEATQKPVLAVATFGNGCYWCTEAVFQELDGIESVVSGFSGGERLDVTYEEVCSGTTGHAEVVHITYDPAKVSFVDLLQGFFLTHDPTTLNRQGADRGTQYRSVVFYHSDEQKQLTEKAIEELTKAGAFEDPIVTEVTAYKNFITAGDYHQDYFDKNPNDRYCLYNIPKKVQKIKKAFKGKLKSD